MAPTECRETDGVNERREEWAVHRGLAVYKNKPGCDQVSSDHSLVTMRLLALLLMVGAAGKDT